MKQPTVIEKIIVKPGADPKQLQALQEERARMREAIERKAQADKELILAETNMAATTVKERQEELKLKQSGLENERIEREKLKEKLSNIENKLLHGTKTIDDAKRQARDLEKQLV